MKTFRNYITEALSGNEKLVQKLEKTRASMHNHWKRGGESHHSRGLQLIYRYNDLKNKLTDTAEGNDHWKAYCKKHGFHPQHQGHDHYA